MQRFTNHPGDLLAARTFADLAIAAGALRLYVTFDDFYDRKEQAYSQFRGVPLVDANAFLAPVNEADLTEDPRWSTFATDWVVSHEPQLHTVAIRVGTAPRTSGGHVPSFSDRHDLEEGEVPDDATPLPCPDLSLASPQCACVRAYPVLVGNPGKSEDDSFFVLSLLFEASPTRGQQSVEGGSGCPTRFKRVRLE